MTKITSRSPVISRAVRFCASAVMSGVVTRWRPQITRTTCAEVRVQQDITASRGRRCSVRMVLPIQSREQVAANRYAEFKINGLKNLSASDITKLEGTTRTITATAFGDVRVHGRISEVSLPIELSFEFQEEQLKSVSILSKDTLDISLEKHDVRPRSAFNILADKTLDALGQKVAKVAKISLHIFAQPES